MPRACNPGRSSLVGIAGVCVMKRWSWLFNSTQVTLCDQNAGTVTCKTMSMGCLVGFPDSRARDRLAMLFNRPLLLTLNNQPCCIAACELAIDVLSRATPTELLSCSRPRSSSKKPVMQWVHRSRGLSATLIFWSQNPGPNRASGPNRAKRARRG